MRPRTTENSCLAQENPRNLAGLLAERSGGGFASSPDVPARALGPRIIDSLHAGCRVERETSGLARIFHSLSHRYDHLPASGSSDGGSQGICGLVSKPPLRGAVSYTHLRAHETV